MEDSSHIRTLQAEDGVKLSYYDSSSGGTQRGSSPILILVCPLPSANLFHNADSILDPWVHRLFLVLEMQHPGL